MTRLTLILLLCCGLLMATGCNTDPVPTGSGSGEQNQVPQYTIQFTTVFENIEPPDQYYGQVWNPALSVWVGALPETPPACMVAITGKKISSIHYYAERKSAYEISSGYTLTQIRVESLLYKDGEPAADNAAAVGGLKAEYYAYSPQKDFFQPLAILERRLRTVQQQQEYLFLLEEPTSFYGQVAWSPVLVEKVDEQIWQFTSTDQLSQMQQIYPDCENLPAVLEILQKYRQEQ